MQQILYLLFNFIKVVKTTVEYNGTEYAKVDRKEVTGLSPSTRYTFKVSVDPNNEDKKYLLNIKIGGKEAISRFIADVLEVRIFKKNSTTKVYEFNDNLKLTSKDIKFVDSGNFSSEKFNVAKETVRTLHLLFTKIDDGDDSRSKKLLAKPLTCDELLEKLKEISNFDTYFEFQKSCTDIKYLKFKDANGTVQLSNEDKYALKQNNQNDFNDYKYFVANVRFIADMVMKDFKCVTINVTGLINKMKNDQTTDNKVEFIFEVVPTTYPFTPNEQVQSNEFKLENEIIKSTSEPSFLLRHKTLFIVIIAAIVLILTIVFIDPVKKVKKKAE
ncbi:hypothetical protein HERIO_1096 [Hepatospora eriocheir]|uniref:Uncharacterized protein n=1 Tax=Hepatospora eriocheir TaxID=1081669 RepID=A0A1X0QBD3_9MICR|nr:hypothetical protein HERIO_1096 [Hepatospora eriocheir]